MPEASKQAMGLTAKEHKETFQADGNVIMIMAMMTRISICQNSKNLTARKFYSIQMGTPPPKKSAEKKKSDKVKGTIEPKHKTRT